MIWSAALPGAASRVLRVAAGRRALHVALLVGGLFVLGLLCGGRAQAADEAPAPMRDTVGRVLGVADRAQSPLDAVPAQQAGTGSGQGSGPVPPGLRPVSEHIVRTVEDRVVRPVGDVVATVTGTLEAVAGTGAGTGTGAEAPPLQVLPDTSGIGDLTGHAQPAEPEQQPGSSSPSESATGPATGLASGTETGTGAAPAPAAADASGAADPSGAADAEGARSPARTAGYGPRSGPATAPVTPAVPTAHVGAHRAASERTGPAGYAPVRPAPGGDPDGALGTASGADHGTPRHGDACAVTPQYRIAFRLVPGAPERADAAGLREQYRDIPVSPA
ncbi:hypothetical protein [Streptomyces sp. BK208]|uniref:hypothetical protein n=1 Tax=Streptomyces sp. BK208 TaxID=2512150 RepID=UPI00105D5B60|nr:hypothetical protein [Streptomyces sp. BK208]